MLMGHLGQLLGKIYANKKTRSFKFWTIIIFSSYMFWSMKAVACKWVCRSSPCWVWETPTEFCFRIGRTTFAGFSRRTGGVSCGDQLWLADDDCLPNMDIGEQDAWTATCTCWCGRGDSSCGSEEPTSSRAECRWCRLPPRPSCGVSAECWICGKEQTCGSWFWEWPSLPCLV